MHRSHAARARVRAWVGVRVRIVFSVRVRTEVSFRLGSG